MMVLDRTARAPRAPGRLRLTLLAWVCAALVGCAGASAPPETAGPALPDPVVTPGTVSAGDEARAAALFRTARETFEQERWLDAAEIARQTVERFPSAGVSGRALWLEARAAFQGEAWDAAAAAAIRYDGLLGAGDPRHGEVRTLAARALLERGDVVAALAMALTVPPASDAGVLEDALGVVRQAAASASTDLLAEALVGADGESVLTGAARARLAARLRDDFEDERARAEAQRALDAGAVGPDADTARMVLEAPPLPRSRQVAIAAVLPTSGSPALQQFARQVAEGVQVAAAEAGDDLVVEVRAVDDHGDVGETAQAVRALADGSVLGAVGFLEDLALEAAVDARQGPLTLVSPTARTVGDPGDGAYSLAGADPAAARAVARWATRQGFARVAILHSATPGSVEEADAFAAELAGSGGPSLVGRWSYEAGATFFQDQVRAAREVLRLEEVRALRARTADTIRADTLAPVALFVPVPPEDVEYLAPQLTFFGLDTLGIRVLGTSGWTDPQVLETVSDRHTDGVVATAPVAAGEGSRGFRAFREAYERHFRRTLRSPVPALGWDATLLLLEAIRSGADTPARVQAAMERVRGVDGATGLFSVEEGRVVRSQEVVRILRRSTIPAG